MLWRAFYERFWNDESTALVQPAVGELRAAPRGLRNLIASCRSPRPHVIRRSFPFGRTDSFSVVADRSCCMFPWLFVFDSPLHKIEEPQANPPRLSSSAQSTSSF